MLYKLSTSNIKRSFKDYAIYFITLILGVCIFYVFNSLDSQTAMLEVTSRQGTMIKVLINLLNYVSIFVSFILGFLIIYASRFLIKKRNKEFGIYMALGMSKRKISMLLLLETLIIGLFSLGLGLILGIVISQITSVFVANMFEANMSNFTFNFSKAATLKTINYFTIIYLIVMVFNTIIINKNKLINLLNASKKQENIKIKNSLISVILFIISAILLGRAYYMVTIGAKSIVFSSISSLIVPVVLGIIGTILFYYSVAGMMLKVLSKRHKLYSKKLNTFVFKQINSKINTMIISVSVICVMLFFTFCLLSTTFTMKNYFNNSLTKNTPVDIELVSYKEKKVDFSEFLNDNDIKNNIKDITSINAYSDDITYEKYLGKEATTVKNKYPFLKVDSPIILVKESDYNKLATLYKMDKVNLKNDEYALVSDYLKQTYEKVIKNNTISISGHILKPNSNKVINGFLFISSIPANNGYMVIKDNLINENNNYSQLLLANYNTKNKETIEKIEKKVSKFKEKDDFFADTKIQIRESSNGVTTIVTFIGLYLGIIFLISSSAILSLKELSDSIDDKNKYKVLRQIGADEKEINKALFKQALIFFMMPLSLAIVHTIFGISFCTFLLSSLGIKSALDGVLITLIFLVLIYGIYFTITYLCSKRIIKENN